MFSKRPAFWDPQRNFYPIRHPTRNGAFKTLAYIQWRSVRSPKRIPGILPTHWCISRVVGSGGLWNCNTAGTSTAFVPESWRFKIRWFSLQKIPAAQPWNVFVGWERWNQPHRNATGKNCDSPVWRVYFTCSLIRSPLQNTTEIEDGFGLRKKHVGKWLSSSRESFQASGYKLDVRFGVRSLPGCERHQRFPLQKLEQRFAQEDLLSRWMCFLFFKVPD